MKHWIVGRTQALHIQFLRYFFVGASSTIVDMLVYALLMQYLGIHYLIAAFVGYMFGLLWNYYLCVLWIFESKHNRLKEFILVFLVALGGLFWTELLLYLSVEFLHIGPLVAKLIVVWIVLMWNFGMRKFYVFG